MPDPVTLSQRQRAIILAALATCTPSGGGSEIHRVYLDLSERFGMQANERDVSRYTANVVSDAIEAGAITATLSFNNA